MTRNYNQSGFNYPFRSQVCRSMNTASSTNPDAAPVSSQVDMSVDSSLFGRLSALVFFGGQPPSLVQFLTAQDGA